MLEGPPSASPPAGRRRRWPRLPKPAPIEWICLISGLYLTIHYAWLLDDAYVYFRYVDNLLYLKHGLVFNAGEYVEGFSSPLWTILLFLLRLTGLNFWIITRLVGVAAFVGFWMLLVALNRRLSPPQTAVLNFPLCYLGLNYGVLCYFTSGMETPLVQVAAVVYALFVLNPASRVLQVLLALTPILRHEMAVPFAICLVWAWMRRKRFPWGLLSAGVAVTGSWVAFRIYYYADLFPNTFYLKNEADFTQGWLYLQDTVGPYWLHAVLGALILLTLVFVFKKPAGHVGEQNAEGGAEAAAKAEVGRSLEIRARLLMVALAVAYAVYVIKIGGDARHYRYLAFPFCLCVCAFAGIVEQMLARFSLRTLRAGTTVAGVVVALGAAACYPYQLSAHPFFGKETHTTINKINDASAHKHPLKHAYTRFVLSPWEAGEEIEFKEDYARFRRENPGRAYRELAARQWCALLYEKYAARAVHSLGLTDPILARTEMKSVRPAHKPGLQLLATDIIAIIGSPEKTPGQGMYREAVERGKAPRWVVDNLESIEIIERKMFNTHDFIENLRLALTFPEKIKLHRRR